MSARELITEHLDLWTGAVTKKSSSGRGSNGKVELTGVKKLRELILELAVRGNLIEQDASDEPAHVLLARLRGERLELEKNKKIKKRRKTNESISVDELTNLPSNWCWSQLGEVAFKLTDGSHNPPKDAGRGLPMLSSQNVNFGKIDFDSPSRYLTVEDFVKEDARTETRPGDILLTIVASLGRAAVVPPEAPQFALQRSVAVISTPINSEFLAYQLIAPQCLDYYDTHGKGTAQKGIYLGKLAVMPIAVPPLEEQNRIVQKVDELMALCDRLEQQTSDQLEAHETLVDTLLGTLTQSENATELADNWARLAAHFDTLFATEQSIDKLKQTILQLAVMGRLVEQDMGDIHAKELVAAATQARENLIRKSKLKKPRKSKIPNEDERFHRLPYGWSRVKVCELFQLQNGYAFKSSWFAEDGPRLLRNVNISHGYIDWSDSVSLPESMAVEFARFELKEGDIVISLDRPLISTGLKYAIIRDCDVPCLLLQRVARFRQYSDIVHTGYLEYWLNSEMFTSSIDPGRSNGVPHISTGQIEALNFPLPPKEEQHRIVQKVDELMALCDQLKERLSQASETRCQLAEAIVEKSLG